MRHWDFLEHRIFLPMLINGVDSSVKTSFFYLAKMFRDHTFDVCLDAAIKDMEGMQNIFVTMGYDTASKQYILKLINLQDKKVTLQPEVSGFKRPVKAQRQAWYWFREKKTHRLLRMKSNRWRLKSDWT